MNHEISLCGIVAAVNLPSQPGLDGHSEIMAGLLLRNERRSPEGHYVTEDCRSDVGPVHTGRRLQFTSTLEIGRSEQGLLSFSMALSRGREIERVRDREGERGREKEGGREGGVGLQRRR